MRFIFSLLLKGTPAPECPTLVYTENNIKYIIVRQPTRPAPVAVNAPRSGAADFALHAG